MPVTTRRRPVRELIALLLVLAMSATGQDIIYRKSRRLGERQRVDLVFSGQNQELLIREKGTVVQRVPYDSIDLFRYGISKRRRMSEAGNLLFMNLNAGILAILTVPVTVCIAVPLMFTKETKHRLNLDFQDGGGSRSLAFQLDKSEYRRALDTIRTQTNRRLETQP